MSAQQNHTVWTFYLSATAGIVPVGKVLCLNADASRYVISTAANRALQTLGSVCVVLTAGDEDNLAVEGQFCGMVPNSVTHLGEGDAVPIRVSTTGDLERVASPTVDDEVVGHCDELGNALVMFATQANIVSGAGEFNTASNVGVGAGESFKQKVGVDLEFRTIKAGSYVTVTNNALDITLAANASAIMATFAPGGTDTQVYYNNAGALATTSQASIVGGRLYITSPVVSGTPVYRVAGLDIVSYVTQVTTSATTQVNCGTVAIADNTTATIDVIVRSHRDTSNTKRGTWKFSATVSRNGGAAVLDVLNVGDAFNMTAGTVTCDVNSNDFRVRITPADTDARKWDSEIRVQVNT